MQKAIVFLVSAATLLVFLTSPRADAAYPRGRFNIDNVAIRYNPNLSSPAKGYGAINQVTCIYYVSDGEAIPGNRYWLNNGNANRVGFSPEMRIDHYIGGTCDPY